jgi:predicted metal-dependent enzyme (double-stranded beta helix superfamily)
VSASPPPGDIHRVTNSGATAGVSLHMYGTEIGRIGPILGELVRCPSGHQALSFIV